MQVYQGTSASICLNSEKCTQQKEDKQTALQEAEVTTGS
jgi:hypothetical protein